jgi:hypothetical protein
VYLRGTYGGRVTGLPEEFADRFGFGPPTVENGSILANPNPGSGWGPDHAT